MPAHASYFAEDLRRFGPDGSESFTRAEAQAYCARLAATHYENFSVVSWLTPRRLRPAFEAVYAFCRWSDDLADEVGDRQRSTELLSWWRGELHAMYAGTSRHPVFIALTQVVQEFGISIDPFEALISAFEQDQIVNDYDTYARLLAYCTRSANPVGHLVLYMSRAYEPENARLSDRTCTALQLANFWQDVARDLAIGRVYIPREDREQFGIRLEDLRAKAAGSAFREMMRVLVERTRTLFAEGLPLARRLPKEIAPSIELFSRGGKAILDRIAGQGYDVLRARPALSRATKLRLIGRTLVQHWFAARPRRVP